MPHLVFMCGHAGTGKTTIAHYLVERMMREHKMTFACLDKDTVYGDYSARMMLKLTGDAHDRDSPAFQTHCRTLEYEGLLKTAREQLTLGINTLLIAPFSQEIMRGDLINPAWLNVPASVTVSVVWVHINEAAALARIQTRNDPRDTYKLTHWSSYIQRRVNPPDAPWITRYDNTDWQPHAIDNLAKQLINNIRDGHPLTRTPVEA